MRESESEVVYSKPHQKMIELEKQVRALRDDVEKMFNTRTERQKVMGALQDRRALLLDEISHLKKEIREKPKSKEMIQAKIDYVSSQLGDAQSLIDVERTILESLEQDIERESSKYADAIRLYNGSKQEEQNLDALLARLPKDGPRD